MTKQQTLLAAIAAVFLILASAGAASYFTKTQLQNEQAETAKAGKTAQATTRRSNSNIKWDGQSRQVQQVQVQPQLPPCNDNNIIGTAAGAVGGGLLGSQFGKGNGKTAAAVVGVVGGAALGNKMIPTQNVTCR